MPHIVFRGADGNPVRVNFFAVIINNVGTNAIVAWLGENHMAGVGIHGNARRLRFTAFPLDLCIDYLVGLIGHLVCNHIVQINRRGVETAIASLRRDLRGVKRGINNMYMNNGVCSIGTDVGAIQSTQILHTVAFARLGPACSTSGLAVEFPDQVDRTAFTSLRHKLAIFNLNRIVNCQSLARSDRAVFVAELPLAPL